jgi:uncharacterized protein YjbI with pentapeptide repeats
MKLYIPAIPFWSFGERLPVVERPDELGDPLSISSAFARLASLINNRLDWKAIDMLADPHELLEKRAEAEHAVKRAERARRTSRRLTWSALVVIVILLLASMGIFQKYQEAGTQAVRADLLRQISDTKSRGDVRLAALNRMRSKGYTDLGGVDLSHLDLRNSSWSGLNLTNADFSSAYLESANFTGASTGYAKFVRSNLRAANFADMLLFKVDFTGANLSGANFTNVRLTDCDLRGANLVGLVVIGAEIDASVFYRAELEQSLFSPLQLHGALVVENSPLNNAR